MKEQTIWDIEWMWIVAGLGVMALLAGISLGLLYLAVRVVRLAWVG